MARYFFDTDDGRPLSDDSGVELASFALARREAMEAAGRMIIDSADEIKENQTWQLFVRDEDGNTRYWITVIATEPVSSRKLANPSQLWQNFQAGRAKRTA